MRYASYHTAAGELTWGAEQDGVLYDLGPTGLAVASSLKSAITDRALEPAPALDGAPQQPVEGTRFAPVIPDPGKIICIGVNYKTHQEETGRADAVAPTIFFRFADTLTAHDAPAPLPSESEKYDYEGEVALVIGEPAYKVSQDDSWGVIAGYAAFNDLSARDWQRHTHQWGPGKNFPESGPFGPYFVPAADLGDVTALTLETRVNGEVRQHATLASLIFDIPSLIEYVTTFTPLAPGDVIVTGTPGGVGLFHEPPVFLADGDVVEVEVTGLGVLRNTIAA